MKCLRYLADALTLTRIILAIFLIIWGIVGGSIGAGFLVFVLAELTDAFDGTCSRKWPFAKGEEPKYRKWAVQYDMIADALLWGAAVLFFTLEVNVVVGLIILLGVAIIAAIIEFVVYGKLFGHPDNCTEKSLCKRDFNRAKEIIMTRRKIYIWSIVIVAIWLLAATEWPDGLKIAILVIGVAVGIFLWFFLKQRREHISRNAVDLEKTMSQKNKRK